jgi:hypothetical protein
VLFGGYVWGARMNQREKLLEIIRLHDEAYEHAMQFDGHHKSSEGWVSVGFGTVFDRYDGLRAGEINHVEIYSYVLGPSRIHHFDSLDEALATMRDWHREEMESTE